MSYDERGALRQKKKLRKKSLACIENGSSEINAFLAEPLTPRKFIKKKGRRRKVSFSPQPRRESFRNSYEFPAMFFLPSLDYFLTR